jgi:hypothetical protein
LLLLLFFLTCLAVFFKKTAKTLLQILLKDTKEKRAIQKETNNYTHPYSRALQQRKQPDFRRKQHKKEEEQRAQTIQKRLGQHLLPN